MHSVHEEKGTVTSYRSVCWGLVTFVDQKTLKKVIDALKPIEGADTKGLPNETWESVTGSLLVSEATIGYDGHAQLKAMVQNVLIDQAGKHFDPIVTAVESMQVFLTKTFGPIGAKIPLAAAADMRRRAVELLRSAGCCLYTCVPAQQVRVPHARAN